MHLTRIRRAINPVERTGLNAPDAVELAPEVAFAAGIKPSSGGNIPSLGIGYFFFPSGPNCFRYAVFDRYSEIPFGMTRLDRLQTFLGRAVWGVVFGL